MTKTKNNKTKESSAFDSFEEQEAVLSEVKIDVVFGLVGYIRSEVSSNKTMPVSVVFTIQFVLQMGCHLLGRVHFLQSVFGSGQNISLHFRIYVSCLDDWFVLFVLLHLLV